MESNSKKIKIVFIAGTLGNGGAERQLYYIVKFLKLRNYDILVVSLSKNKYYLKKISDLGVEIKLFKWKNNPIFKLYFIFKHCFLFHPNIIQSAHTYVNFYAMLVSKVLNVKFYASIRNSFNSNNKFKLLKIISLKNADIVVCNSLASIDQIRKSIPKHSKLFYLANYIDTSFFKPDFIQKIKSLRLLYLGGLRQVKRIDKFLFICHYLKSRNIKFKAKIVGSGNLEKHLKDIAKSFSLSSKDLKFISATDSVLDYYNWSNILIQTSSSEGMSNVIIESMACGLLVFSTNVGDAPHLIESCKNGFIFNSHNSNSMSKEFLRTIQDKSIDFDKIRNNAVKTINGKHTFKQFNLNLSKLYENY